MTVIRNYIFLITFIRLMIANIKTCFHSIAETIKFQMSLMHHNVFDPFEVSIHLLKSRIIWLDALVAVQLKKSDKSGRKSNSRRLNK